MKDLAAALEEDVASSGVPKNERLELVLDGKCRATDLSCLSGMDALSKLSLCNVGLSSLNGFPSLPNLSKLTLADNRILDGLQHLVAAELPMLKTLSLAHNRIADIQELLPLQGLHLTHLDLCECPLTQSTADYRQTVLDMFPDLEVLDNLDREGIELLDDDDDEDYTSEEDEELDDEESDADDDVMDEPELLNLVTDSEDEEEEEQLGGHEEGEAEEIHVSVLAGPPIADEKSDEDQDYIMPDDEPESEEASFDSDEHVSVSQHFAAASSSAGPAAAGSSDPSSGAKRKRTTHGTEDLQRDFRPDEDYADI